ncbi:uncharacterized protein [Glycine max]|uniref:uncharacterized protein isoform X4 n=2 Tax=Glycine subgen. Soja TaxID=1462606 RepID=UPI001B35695B|nr:uncharacterized protein LOC100778172 isoform X4 [Glycine max]
MITVIFFRKSIIQNFEFDWLFHSPIYFVLCSSSLFLDSPFNPKRIVVTCEREEEITMKTPTTKVVNLKTKKSLSKRPRLQDVIDIDTPIRAIACLKKIDDMRRFEETEDCFILGFDPYAAVGLSVDSSADDVSVIAEKGKILPHRLLAEITPTQDICVSNSRLRPRLMRAIVKRLPRVRTGRAGIAMQRVVFTGRIKGM